MKADNLDVSGTKDNGIYLNEITKCHFVGYRILVELHIFSAKHNRKKLETIVKT